jgi:cytochrome P450
VSELAFDHRIHCVNEKHPESSTVREVVNAIEEFFVQLGRLAFSFPFWRFYPTSDWRKFEKAGTFIYSIVRKYIERAQQDLAEKAEKNITDNGKKSILEEFLLRKEKYDLKLEDVVSIMTDFLVAGVDTTSNSLYYMLYELGINPDIQER